MLLWPVSHIFTVVCSKSCCFRFFNSCKILKMLKMGWFKQNYCISGMPQGIPMQFFAQQCWKSCCCVPVLHIFTVVCSKLYFFKNFNSLKMLEILKIGCFKLFLAKLLYLRCISRYSYTIFFSTVVKVMLLWPVSHLFTVVCSKMCCFKFFNSCKMVKMLKIGCFKQNYCISSKPQGILMQFFAQQWWKSCCCDQFYTY